MQSSIPSSFSKYFWDTKPQNISIEKHSTYIIERLLEFGDIEQLDWLNTIYPRNTIIDTIKKL